jgi:hypothetical protein
MDVVQTMEVQSDTPIEPAQVDINQLQVKTLVMKKISATVSSGLPPRMEISHEIIDFGELQESDVRSEFFISNKGASALTVRLLSESWLELLPREFVVQPGEQQAVQAILRTSSPKPKSGPEYRTASACTVETNIGTEVIGARYKVQTQLFYKLGWGKAIAGTTLGMILLLSCICLIGAAFLLSR